MWATLTSAVAEFTRPIYSSISFGLFPAASTRAGLGIRVGLKDEGTSMAVLRIQLF
jgi:hypothetical protein